MAHFGVMTPRGYEAVVRIRMPAPFRDLAVACLSDGGREPVSEEAIVTFFQRAIDDVFIPPCMRGEDPPSCDLGGGMRHPDEIDGAALD